MQLRILTPLLDWRTVQAFSRTHSQSSRSFHSYHLYHSYHPGFAPNFLRFFGCSFSTRHLAEDLIEIFLLVVCSVAILLVHANVNLFLSWEIDHFRMLSRLSVFATTCLTSLAVLLALSKVFRVQIFSGTGRSQRGRLCFRMKRR